MGEVSLALLPALFLPHPALTSKRRPRRPFLGAPTASYPSSYADRRRSTQMHTDFASVEDKPTDPLSEVSPFHLCSSVCVGVHLRICRPTSPPIPHRPPDLSKRF